MACDYYIMVKNLQSKKYLLMQIKNFEELASKHSIDNAVSAKIYLNGEHLNPNTPLHESGHIFVQWAKEKAPEIYKKGIELISNSSYRISVEANKFYIEEALKAGAKGSIKYNEYMQHEALSKAIGDKGAQFITESRSRSFTDWAKNLWNKSCRSSRF